MKITLTTGRKIHITRKGTPISLCILGLANEINQIADEVHVFNDQPGNKIAFLVYEGGKIKFFKHSAGRDEPVYIRDISLQLLDNLKVVELEIVQKLGHLEDFAEGARHPW